MDNEQNSIAQVGGERSPVGTLTLSQPKTRFGSGMRGFKGWFVSCVGNIRCKVYKKCEKGECSLEASLQKEYLEYLVWLSCNGQCSQIYVNKL